MILVQPQSTFIERRAAPPDDTLVFTRADVRIYYLLAAGPMPLMTLLNKAARMIPARSKRERVAVKREILLRLGTLIREGNLRLIRRIFVASPLGSPQKQEQPRIPVDWRGSTP